MAIQADDQCISIEEGFRGHTLLKHKWSNINVCTLYRVFLFIASNINISSEYHSSISWSASDAGVAFIIITMFLND